MERFAGMERDLPSEPLPGWLIDETASAGRENLDAAHVARYDSKEDADADAEAALLESLGIGPTSTVIDLGAGTGQFTVAMAATGAHVVAVDVSSVMLQRLQTKVADRENVTIARAGFLTFDHPGKPVEAVYSRYALHHLPDFWKTLALVRIHGLLRPGGIFRLWDVVYSFPAAEAARRVERWCATGSAAGDDGWQRWELAEHIRDEHSTFSWLLEPMLEHAGFAIDRAEYSDDAFTAKYLLVKR